ncbi:glycosyl hydrolase family 43 protein [Coleophoma crateriformis]|uniref:Glycosyl hydrolase family 43 protein n=1 Tax=Coleophoma crateriformis TaxID=565419 RepID=A0A3D8SBE2_9HELO|nr:glycosyl hydrolase family 43 protein [Coleophoma crateriformis]
MSTSQELNCYKNPIIPGFNPDPSITGHNGDFWLVTSSFEYFPGIPIYHSRDLIKWELIGHALTRRSQLDIRTPEPGGGIWAPTIRLRDGVFYITAACFDRYRPQDDDRVSPHGFHVKTANIWDSTSWSDPIFFSQVGFDQDLFWDDDGTVYLSSTYRKLCHTPGSSMKDFAVHICTVDLATGNSTSTPRLIRESKFGVSEGSHIFRRGRYYYLFTAEGGTESGHSEWVSRSETGPFGPWELGPKNPLWRNGVDDEVQNTGHADFVTDSKGRWWGVLLGVRPTKTANGWSNSVFGRETFLVPVTWQDDWPVLNRGQKVTLLGSALGLYEIDLPIQWRDDFDQDELQLGWYRKNTPQKIDFSMTENPGALRLYGAPYTLSSPASPTMFLRKQKHRRVTWRTQVSFNPTSLNTEAGAVVFWNYLTYSSIGIRQSPSDSSSRIVRFRSADLAVVDFELQSDDAALVLMIECGDAYRFGFREVIEGDANGLETEVRWIGEVSNDIMTADPPIGAAFTGMMLGLYAFGDLEQCLVPADFDYAEFY